MRRVSLTPRSNWVERVERLGFSFHTGESPYWDESVCYELTAFEVGVLESATAELHRLCLEAVECVVREDRFRQLHIPERYVPLVKRSWERQDKGVMGRFDLAYGGTGAPKMYEYNADTPTALLEAAVVQWDWLESVAPEADQFNSIHERLIARWQEIHLATPAHFACVREHEEDFVTTVYLEDTAQQAGWKTRRLFMDQIGWDGRKFVDLTHEPITTLCKLYPWEWLIDEPFSRHLLGEPCRMIEPAWKMILSNKGLLPLLWELFPSHPNLLPAYFDAPKLGTEYAKKPMLGREGANITLHARGQSLGTEGHDDDGRFVYQELCIPPHFDGNFAVIGSWVIGDEPGGIGIRESDQPITGNTSRFVPHLFR